MVLGARRQIHGFVASPEDGLRLAIIPAYSIFSSKVN
jgi:hypothetical protein